MAKVSFDDLVKGLRAWAHGNEAATASVELLAWHGFWLRRADFLGACVSSRQGMSLITWRAAREFVDAGPRGSTSEVAILDLAVAIGENRYRLAGFGHAHRRAVVEAVASAVGIDIAKPAVPELSPEQRLLVDAARAAHARIAGWVPGGEPPSARTWEQAADSLADLLGIIDQLAPKGAGRG